VIAQDLVAKCNDGQLPTELEPTVHLYYEMRVKDVFDDLPKFSDFPAEFGGSGVMLDNQGNTVTPE